MNKPMIFSKNSGVLVLAVLCCTYLAAACLFNAYTWLQADEFWFAHATYKYLTQVPYRDFAPYKTVLGYYCLAIPIFLFQQSQTLLIIIKNSLALINAVAIFFSACLLMRWFSKTSVIVGLTLLLNSECFLVYGTQIRVDVLSYWLCLAAILTLLQKKPNLAGCCIGIAFAFSQKALWYILATNGMLLINFLLFERTRKNLKAICFYNFWTCLSITAYLLFWSLFAPLQNVIHSVFQEASIMYQLDYYAGAKILFWMHIIRDNPLLFLLLPFTSISLLLTFQQDRHYRIRFLILTCSYLIYTLFLIYQQNFPYYTQVMYPIFLLAYTAFFDWFFKIIYVKKCESPYLEAHMIVYLSLGYAGVLVYLLTLLQLPVQYFLMLFLPMLITYLVTTKHLISKVTTAFAYLTIIFFVMGSLYGVFQKLPLMDGRYQQANIRMLSQFMQAKEPYIAGTHFLPAHDQAIDGLKHLMAPAIAYLQNPTPALSAVMLASLEEDPNFSIPSILQELEVKRVKWYVNSYRFEALPDTLKKFLTQHFRHFWGSLYLYSPMIAAGSQSLNLWFSGSYRIKSDNPVYLNEERYEPGKIYDLPQGVYVSQARQTYQLIYMPNLPALYLDKTFQQDNWQRMVF